MDIIQDYIKKVLPGRGWIKAGSQVKFFGADRRLTEKYSRSDEVMNITYSKDWIRISFFYEPKDIKGRFYEFATNETNTDELVQFVNTRSV